MAVINKEGIVRRLHDKMGEGLAKAHNTVDAVVDVLVDILNEGHDVRIKGFGMFHLKHVKERKVNIPLKDSSSNIVPAHTGVQFKISAVLKDKLKDVKVSPY